MLAIERKKQILDDLKLSGTVLVADLAKQFGVTEETARRDLVKLEQEGFLERTYGGAISKSALSNELPMAIRETWHSAEKKAIAKLVCDQIEEGKSLMLDASSTAFMVAKAIKEKKGITVVTNSVKIINELADQSNVQLLSTGGRFKTKNMAFVGQAAIDMIQHYHVDYAIVSCKGLDLERGATETDEEEAVVKRWMSQAAKETWMVVDSSKLDQSAFYQYLGFESINRIFCDTELSKSWLEKAGANAIKVHSPVK